MLIISHFPFNSKGKNLKPFLRTLPLNAARNSRSRYSGSSAICFKTRNIRGTAYTYAALAQHSAKGAGKSVLVLLRETATSVSH